MDTGSTPGRAPPSDATLAADRGGLDAATPDDALVRRIDQQIEWYDQRSRRSQRLFKSLKAIQIVSAASIPVLTSVGASPWIAGFGGALIVALEGIQQLNQYQQLWVSYRATAEALKHERFLALAGAGPYADKPPRDVQTLLVERTEQLISREDTSWVGLQQRSGGASG